MIDPRIYRAGLVPLLLALVVAAFSIQNPPAPLAAGLPPDSFSGTRAFSRLQELAARFPSREPGSAGDRALADHVRGTLAPRRRRSASGTDPDPTTPADGGFKVRTHRFTARTARGHRELETVIAERTGLSRRRIVVVAHRDALSRPASAQLSATAALLELAAIFEGRTLRKTLLLVSTSGGSGGAAGAADLTSRIGGSVDAVLVLGDLAGTRVRRPLVVPWSNGVGFAPFDLRGTTAAATRQETGLRPGEPGLAAQFARLSFPLTVSPQGELLARGVPAVTLSASGERGPEPGAPVSAERFAGFGRAALRAVTALDARRSAAPAPRAELHGERKLLPGWTVRALVAALVLPGLLAAIDGFARVRRRRHAVGPWVAWVLSSALPFALALAFIWLLSLIGLAPAVPPAPAPVGAIPLGVGAIAVMALTVLAGVVGWLVVRPAVLRLAGVHGDPGTAPGAPAAFALVLAALVSLTWLANPFAAALLVAPLHAWMAMAAPEVRVRRGAAVAVVALTVLPAALVTLYYALVLGAGPLSLAWTWLQLAIGGHLGLLGVAGWSLLFGCAVSLMAILRSRRFEAPISERPATRGPVTYAGPGSLGGTESALRR